MKKLLVSLVALATVSGFAADFRLVSLLNGSNVRVVDNTTVSVGDTNVYYTRPNGYITYSYTSTNYVPVYTNGVFASNSLVVNTNMTSPGAFAAGEVVVPASTVPTNICLSVTGASAASLQTNILTITLQKTADGSGWDTVNTTSVAFTNNSATAHTMVYSLPSTFLIGAHYVRVGSIAANNDSSDGTNSVASVGLGYWVP